ncbi:ATP-dependent Clp protease ATP-binding subunit ClpC [Lactococcus hodotermopsidis]|uniref:ATP-dependent Clp protease ATP-binding subunit ClpC n=1 Tax=Pseudolactococcus hodotermopsidis TaxID=2709157 RepID=A0A6A0BD68_9LACT|nr:ATP-dependent Clp protease ATP-binding subunit [Lactococcus hodotermopsidis]GFH42404.1 ATP-dependent Clp protease ATP-binding subunit ClpC [Lactococcus hodotermopsidis]
MTQKYTVLLEKVLKSARVFAAGNGYDYAETAHVLAGMLSVNDSFAQNILDDRDVTLEMVLEEIEHNRLPDKVLEIGQVHLSPKVEHLLIEAETLAAQNHLSETGSEHLLYVLLTDDDNVAKKILELNKIKLSDILNDLLEFGNMTVKKPRRAIMPMSKRQAAQGVSETSVTPTLDSVARDVTADARNGLIDPMIGRDKEIERVVHILSRRTKNNPVLVGEPGVGKSAIIEGLAQRMIDGEVPLDMQGVRLMSLSIANVVAGTKFRGEFEDRMMAIVDEASKDDKTIVFIDELHTIVGAGGGADSVTDASNIMKPALARGDFQLIGATTFHEYQKYIEKDAALERRFAKVIVEEPTFDESIAILQGLKPKFETFHHVTFEPEAIRTAVQLSVRYMPSRRLPDKAIDLLDEAAATVKLSIKSNLSQQSQLDKEILAMDAQLQNAVTSHDLKEAKVFNQELQKLEIKRDKMTIKLSRARAAKVAESDVYAVVSNLTGVPVSQMTKNEMTRLVNLEKELHKRVVGQSEAVTAVASAIRRSRSGISDDKRPMGSFMFLGPTGVGKTELAKALAETVFGDENSMIRLDMSEYMEKFNSSRLVGAPPGYVGYDEGGQLTEQVRNKPYAVVLFDEAEKAHPDVFNLLLQILDDGFITDGKGRKVDFRNTIIIMTSNLGATALRDDKTVGFGAVDMSTNYAAMKSRILEELKKQYRPEFLNRIDEKIVFRSLTENELSDIVKIMAKPLIKRLAERHISLKISASAYQLIAKNGFDPEYGARPIRKALEKKLENPLSDKILSGEIIAGSTVNVGVSSEEIILKVKKSQ